MEEGKYHLRRRKSKDIVLMLTPLQKMDSLQKGIKGNTPPVSCFQHWKMALNMDNIYHINESLTEL